MSCDRRSKKRSAKKVSRAASVAHRPSSSMSHFAILGITYTLNVLIS